MNFPRVFLSCVVALGASLPSLHAQGPDQPAHAPEPAIQTGGEVAAAAAADVWLGLVDDGRYADSWKAAASIFRKDVPDARWQELLAERRRPLGKLLTRKNISRQFTRSVPGAPDGQYVILQYETTFEQKKSGTETLTVLLDADGGWKVAGYLVR